MTHKPFIYPEWHKAQRDLLDALMRVQKNEIPAVLLNWFERHVFEVGTAFSYQHELVEKANVDIEAEGKYRASRMLADKILELGLFTDETYFDVPWSTTKKWRILVFGSPQFIRKDFESILNKEG